MDCQSDFRYVSGFFNCEKLFSCQQIVNARCNFNATIVNYLFPLSLFGVGCCRSVSGPQLLCHRKGVGSSVRWLEVLNPLSRISRTSSLISFEFNFY